MKKTDKNYKYRDILTATDCAIANEIDLRYNDSMNKQKNKTFNGETSANRGGSLGFRGGAAGKNFDTPKPPR